MRQVDGEDWTGQSKEQKKTEDKENQTTGSDREDCADAIIE